MLTRVVRNVTRNGAHRGAVSAGNDCSTVEQDAEEVSGGDGFAQGDCRLLGRELAQYFCLRDRLECPARRPHGCVSIGSSMSSRICFVVQDADYGRCILPILLQSSQLTCVTIFSPTSAACAR